MRLKGKPFAGVICPLHGEQDIDMDNYENQMNSLGADWICPRCGMPSDFNDERYDEIHGEEA